MFFFQDRADFVNFVMNVSGLKDAVGSIQEGLESTDGQQE